MKIQSIKLPQLNSVNQLLKNNKLKKEPDYIPLIFTGKYEHPDDSCLDYLI